MNTGLQLRLNALEKIQPVAAKFIRKVTGFGVVADPRWQQCAPAEEIARWARDERSVNRAECVVILGALTPVEFSLLVQQAGERIRFIVLEVDAAKALAFFQSNLIESILNAKQLGIVFGKDKEQMRRQFYELYNPLWSPVLTIVDTGRNTPDASAYYMRILSGIRDELRLDIFNIGTLVCKGPLWQFNTIKNIPYIVDHPGINALKHLFEGRPAIVAGAGPSLNEALPYMKEYADSFVIISTGTALRPLRDAGIRPDLVVAVDGSHLIAKQFETECSDLYFACSSLVFNDIPRKFKGVFSGGLEASPLDRWLETQLEPRGMMYAGGTVTCSAMYLAAQMGCKKVLTAGLDLCFKDDGTTHAAGTMYDGNRESIERLIEVPGNVRKTVLTTRQFQCYIDLVGTYAESETRTDFFNVNNDGALIRGMTVIPPEEMALFAGEPFCAYDAVRQVHESFVQPCEASFKEQLHELQRALPKLVADSSAAADCCSRIVGLLQAESTDVAAIRAAMQELDQLDLDVDRAGDINILLQMSLWPAMYEFNARNAAVKNDEELKDRVHVFERFRNLYEQTGGAAKWTEDALERMFRYWEKHTNGKQMNCCSCEKHVAAVG